MDCAVLFGSSIGPSPYKDAQDVFAVFFCFAEEDGLQQGSKAEGRTGPGHMEAIVEPNCRGMTLLNLLYMQYGERQRMTEAN